MTLYERILCPPLNNVTTRESTANPVRIILVKSANGRQKTCYDFVTILKALYNAIKSPISLNLMDSWGGPTAVNGQWSGDSAELAANRSDAMIGTLRSTYERFKVMRFSPTLGYSSPIAILSGRIPQNSINSEFQVFKTFSMDIWIAILVSILVVGLTDHYVHRNCYERRYSLIDHFLDAYQSLVGQSVDQYNSFCCLKYSFLICLVLFAFESIIESFKVLILSNLLNDPLIEIDSIDDLARFLTSTRTNVTLVAFQRHSTWGMLKDSREKKFPIGL